MTTLRVEMLTPPATPFRLTRPRERSRAYESLNPTRAAAVLSSSIGYGLASTILLKPNVQV